jgi:hypothetical protein
MPQLRRSRAQERHGSRGGGRQQHSLAPRAHSALTTFA